MYRRKPKPEVRVSEHPYHGRTIFLNRLNYQDHTITCWFRPDPKNSRWTFKAQRDGHPLEGEPLEAHRHLAMQFLLNNGVDPMVASFEDIAALDPNYKQQERGHGR